MQQIEQGRSPQLEAAQAKLFACRMAERQTPVLAQANVATLLDYSLLTGASYCAARSDFNRFPVPAGWSDFAAQSTRHDE